MIKFITNKLPEYFEFGHLEQRMGTREYMKLDTKSFFVRISSPISYCSRGKLFMRVMVKFYLIIDI